MQEKDTVKAYYEANAKHLRQLRALQKKPLCKWSKKDMERIRATRADRDSAVAALTFPQQLRHVEGLRKERVEALTSGRHHKGEAA